MVNFMRPTWHRSVLVRTFFNCSLFLFAAITAIPQQSETLTNDAIAKLVKNDLGAPLIIQMIQTQPGSYSTGSSAVIILKQQGVSDAIISAMLAKKPETAPQPNSHTPDPKSSDPPTSQESTNSSRNIWIINNSTDRMSDQKEFSAILSKSAIVQGKPFGELETTATCDTEALGFKVVYHSDSDIGFKQNDYGQRVVPGGLIGAIIVAAGHQKPWVDMRVRIDKEPPIQVSSEEDYRNVAVIFFTARSKQEAFSAINTPSSSKSQEGHISDFLSLWSAAKSAGSIADVINAHTILIELTLSNGLSTILEINPQDPSFKAFSSRCGVAKPPIITEAPATTRPPARIPYSSLSQQPAEKFNGTSEGFAIALPSFMDRMLRANGADARLFVRETKYIGQLVNTCAGVTPTMIAGVTDSMNRAHVEKLGEEYKRCGGGLLAITPLVKTDFKAGDPVVMLTLPNIDLWKFDVDMKARFTGPGGPYPITVRVGNLRNPNLPTGSLPVFGIVVSASIR
ncbi:MAG: hypothetical protein ABI165_07555 [Bryobacteraceae bacterium]